MTEREYKLVDGVFVGVDDYRDDGPLPPFETKTWPEIILRDAVGWCECVALDHLIPLFVAYLSGEWGRYDPIVHFDQDDPLQTLVAIACDAAQFTEHGGNIGGSWLTDEGERWLTIARATATV